MYMPGCMFAVIDRFHGGVRHSSQVPATEDPSHTGLHGVRADLRQTPAVHFDRGQRRYHCRVINRWDSRDKDDNDSMEIHSNTMFTAF